MIVSVVFCFSCIDSKNDCIERYLSADEWMIEQTRLSGDNQDAKNRIYEKYLEIYAEIDLECNTNRKVRPRL